MASLRGILQRNRGLAMAFGLVLIVLVGYASLPAPGPRVSWRERYTPKEDEDETGFNHDGGQFMISPDGRSILTTFRFQAKIRDVATGRVAELEMDRPGSDARSWMGGAKFLAGGRFLVGLTRDIDQNVEGTATLKVYEIPSGRERIAFTGIYDGSNWSPLAVSRDGSTIAVAMGNPVPTKVGVWSAMEDRPITYFAGKGPLALSDDGRILALHEFTAFDANLIVWDVASSTRLASIAVPGASIQEAIALSPDGKMLVELWGVKAILWDVSISPLKQVVHVDLTERHVTNSSIKHFLPHDSLGYAPWFSPDGSLFYLRRWDSGYVWPIEAWDLKVNPPRRVFRGQALEISRDGHRMLQAGPNIVDHPELEIVQQSAAPLRFVELPSMKPLGRDLEPHGMSVAFNPDARLLGMVYARNEPSLIDQLKGWIPPRMRPTSWKFRRNNRQDEFKVVDVDTGGTLRTVKLNPQSINFDSIGTPGFVEDGRTLALHRWMPPEDPSEHGYDELVELWDIPGPASKWPILGVLAVFALGSGRWYDVRARRRENSAAAPA